jgi:iron complex transport system ATP-binding protein
MCAKGVVAWYAASMLHAQQISVSAGATPLLDAIDLTVQPGECVVVLGPNGAGKTTLLRALLGLVTSAGSVRVGECVLQGLSPRERARALGWLPQTMGLAEPVRAVELVEGGRYRFDEGRSMRRARALDAMAQVGVRELAERLVHTLSGGERQRVALAALVAQEASLWLLDEPASHLDPGVQERVYSFLMDQWREGRGLLLVTHDPDLLLRVLSHQETEQVRVIGLQGGRQVLSSHLAEEALPDKVGRLLGVRMCWADLGERRALAVLGAR